MSAAHNKDLCYVPRSLSNDETTVTETTHQGYVERVVHDRGHNAPSTLVNVAYLQTGHYFKIYSRGIELGNYSKPFREIPNRGSNRKDVTSFTRASRRNLMRTLAKIRPAQLDTGHMVTLTYHYNHNTTTAILRKKFLAYLQYLRDNIENCAYIWRIEFQKRGAIHYHFLIFSRKKDSRKTAKFLNTDAPAAWHRIAGETTEAHLKHGHKTVQITSYRHAVSYCSKYVAKEDEIINREYVGRRWGTSYNLPVAEHIAGEIPANGYAFMVRLVQKYLRTESRMSEEYICTMDRFTTMWSYLDLNKFLSHLERCNPPPESIGIVECIKEQITNVLETQFADGKC